MLSMDICTIVKGCVFEWALDDGQMAIAEALHRMKCFLYSVVPCQLFEYFIAVSIYAD